MNADWLGESQRSRLRRRLKEISVDELVAQARGRAVTRRYAGHPSAIGRVRAATISTHVAARRLGLADANAVDAYVAANDLDALVGTFALAAASDGAFVLRATTTSLDVVTELAERGTVLAALDLAESVDIRERSAGEDGLTEALESFHG
jgi:hypothetical protein